MYFAARQGCAECVTVLASLKADVNFADQDGVTPLIYALINGHYDVAARCSTRAPIRTSPTTSAAPRSTPRST